MNQLKRFALTALTGVLAFSLAEAQTRVVIKTDRTNVRAKPSLDAEILASLSKGQEVEVLGELTPPGSKETWSRIAMPSAVAVWVYGPLVDAKAGTVRAKELNYRAGPGRNYSVLGLLKKGDAIAVARVAGIMAAKKTSDLIPLCHPIALSTVTVDIGEDAGALLITAAAETTGQTGVEMEALTAASVAALTLYDMAKAMDRGMRIDGIHLVEKTGGKSGDYRRDGAPA